MKKRYFRESESENSILYILEPIFHYDQTDVSDRCFQAFDDGILYNWSSDFGRRVDRALESAINDDAESQDLAEYVDEDLKGKVTNIKLFWDRKNDVLRVTVKLAPGVNVKEIEPSVKNYIMGQMSDGWGEGFEQQEIASTDCWAVYDQNNEYDCEFFATERDAANDCRSKQKEAETGWEDTDDDEDHDWVDSNNADFDWCRVTVSLYCSFWGRNSHNPIGTYINGYDINGYDVNGYSKDGFDRWGKDKDGFGRDGYNNSGYDRDGYDKTGFNKAGKDRKGFDRNGEKDLEDNRPMNSKGVKNGALFTQSKDGTVRIKNTFDMGESRRRLNKKSRNLKS